MKRSIIRLFQLLWAFYILYAGIIYIKIYISANNSYEIQNQEFLHFTIYGSSTSEEGNTVSARFSIIDTKGNSITEIERSWSGNYLAVEFNQAKLDGKYFIFPSRIFAKDRIIEGDKKRKQGTQLEKYYEDNRECILLGKNSTKKNREDLYIISRFTNKNYYVPTFGFVNTYILDLSNCEADCFYTISCNNSGKLTLQKM